jgi:hypothetical protein
MPLLCRALITPKAGLSNRIKLQMTKFAQAQSSAKLKVFASAFLLGSLHDI